MRVAKRVPLGAELTQLIEDTETGTPAGSARADYLPTLFRPGFW